MKIFSYKSREYVNPIDLNILGRTFDTLEQGHQQTVKQASDLEVAMANLDLNEAEEGWRQQKINEIHQVVAENTRYGNSYGALDDIVKKAGNLAADPGMIGRLKSQQAYKTYRDKVDKFNISEGMKEMYKERNPYHYEDGPIDTRTGKVTTGKIWEPDSVPVQTVDMFAVRQRGLSIAAKEAGSNERLTFLDANGQETMDASKSADGGFYRKIGTRYERLSEDKIKKAIKLAIDQTPGAMDSLKQDYSYLEYQHEKAVKKLRQNGDNTNPVIDGYTDKNGNIIDFNTWVDNANEGFANVSAYDNVQTSVDWGTALQNQIAAKQQQLAASAAAGGRGGAGTGAGNESYTDVGIVGTVEVESDAYTGAVNAKTAANNQGLAILNKYMGRWAKGMDSITDAIAKIRKENPNIKGPGGAANYIIAKYGKNMNDMDKQNIINSFMGYVRANGQLTSMTNKAGVDKSKLAFSANVASQKYTNDNPYGKDIINQLNNIYKKYDTVQYHIGKDVYRKLLSLYNVDNLREIGLKYNIDEDGNYIVDIDKNHRNLLPTFAANAEKANDNTSGSIGGWLKNTFTGGVADTNGKIVFIKDNENKTSSSIGTALGGLTNTYNKGVNAAAKEQKKAGVAKGTVTLSATGASSIGELYIKNNADARGLTDAQRKAAIEEANNNVDNIFASNNFNNGQIYTLDANGRATKDISKAQEYANLIRYMYQNHRKDVTRQFISANGVKGLNKKALSDGYLISFTVPENSKDDNTEGYRGKEIRLFVAGTVKEGVPYQPSINPKNITNNSILTSKATGAAIENLGYHKSLGDTRIIPRKNGYEINFMGRPKVVNEEAALQYGTDMLRLENMKESIKAGLYNNPNLTAEQNMQLINNSIMAISQDISSITGRNLGQVYTSVVNYFNSED